MSTENTHLASSAAGNTAALTSSLQVLSAAMKLRKIDPELQEIVLDGIRSVAEANSQTLKQYKSCGATLDSLISWCRKPAEGDDFLYALLCHGFTSKRFITYYRTKIDEELSTFYLERDKFERLCWYEKQFSILPNGHWSVPGTNAGKAMLEYVRAELWYIQQRRNYDLAGRPARTNEDRVGDGYRIKVAISADGLAYLFRLLIEAGVVTASPRTKLLDFVAKSFETNGIGNNMLSANSLGKKYEQVVQSTANAVRAMLKRMLKNVDKNYG